MTTKRLQDSLANDALEEGQFELAISTLDILRSPSHKPTVSQLLQLFFIALQPDQDAVISLSGDAPVADPTALLLQSPRKMIKTSKSSLVISQQAIEETRRLLFSFIATNPPNTMAVALPKYREKGQEPPDLTEYWDSTPIFNQSAAILTARSCWEILEGGFKTRTAAKSVLTSPDGKRNPRRRQFAREKSFHDLNAANDEPRLPVDEDAWFLLEWLVKLFQRDADANDAPGEPRHSRLLIEQIPLPPVGSVARWDVKEPLDIVFHALRQTDHRRRQLGVDLFVLLAELNATPHLPVYTFTSSVLTNILVSQDAHDVFTSLLSEIPTSRATLPFKISLSHRVIERVCFGTEDNGASTSRPGVHARPRRAVPAPRAINRNNTSGASSENATTKSVESASTLPTKTSPLNLPSLADITRLLKAPSTVQLSRSVDPLVAWMTPELLVRVKFDLAMACLRVLKYQKDGEQLGIAQEWFDAVNDGNLSDTIAATFGGDGSFYGTILQGALQGTVA